MPAAAGSATSARKRIRNRATRATMPSGPGNCSRIPDPGAFPSGLSNFEKLLCSPPWRLRPRQARAPRGDDAMNRGGGIPRESEHVDFEGFMEGVKRRNPGQIEFIQAVQEVSEDIFEFMEGKP